MALLTVNVNVGEEQVEMVINYFCKSFKYQEVLVNPFNPQESAPNPESKEQFFHRKVKEFIKESVIAGKAVEESNSSRDAVINDLNNSLDIT